MERGRLGIIRTKTGQYAIGRFEYVTRQPKMIVEDALGIKTRGARPIKDVYDVIRKLEKRATIRGKDVDILTEEIRKTTILKT